MSQEQAYNLKNILAITGKAGLHRIITQNNKTIIVESIEDRKVKTPIHTNYQVALLEEITVYTKDESRLTLPEIIESIYNKYELNLPVTVKDAPNKLREFIQEVAPNYDEERVYVSDIQKILKWYHLITKYLKRTDIIPKTEEVSAEDKSNNQ